MNKIIEYAGEALIAISDYLLDSGYYLIECSYNEFNRQRQC